MCQKHLSNKYLYMVFYTSSQHLQMHMPPTSQAVLNFPPMSNITPRNFPYLPFSPLIPTKSTVNKTASLKWVPSKAGAKWWGPFLFFLSDSKSSIEFHLCLLQILLSSKKIINRKKNGWL